MACTTTLLGTALDCGNVGGLAAIYIAPVADVATVSVGADGEVTGITMVSTKTFKTFAFRKGNASFTVSGTRDDKAGTYFASTEVALQMNHMEKSKRTEIVNLATGNVYVIAKDNNGVYWFIGKDSYAAATAAGGQTGAEMGEGNFYNVTLTAQTSEVPNTVLSSIISAIIA